MPEMEDKYADLLDRGIYEDEDVMCNDLGLEYDDLYKDEEEDDDE